MPAVNLSSLVKSTSRLTNNMYILEALSSLFNLSFTNRPTYHPLPDHVKRTFIPSLHSNPDPNLRATLELLVCEAKTTTSATTKKPSASTDQSQAVGNGENVKTKPPPILFLHGGFGHASVWLPFMNYLHHNPLQPSSQTTYSLSLRSHGASTPVSYLRMAYRTPLSTLAADVHTAITHITSLHAGQPPILVAHSSGGGLAQSLLASGAIQTPALVLLDAIPHSGSIAVNSNWLAHDPWFTLRMFAAHLGHPRSPLSNENLVRGAFFGDKTGAAEKQDSARAVDVRDFMRWMPAYESLVWPWQMMGSFWGWLRGRPRWLDLKSILTRISGRDGDRVLVMVGENDVLMDVGICRREAEAYRRGIREMDTGEGRVDRRSKGGRGELNSDMQIDGATVESRDGVTFAVIYGAGHHVQNDVQWEVAAEALRRFIAQV